jgi:UDP-N-acetylmuramate dehydrogenase
MINKINIEENVSLAPMTTLKIGGNARFFVRAETEEQVIEAFKFAKRNSFELFILGGGSNILISDKGFDGLVLQIALKGISLGNENSTKINITVGAGEDWDKFVEFCVEKNFQGIECLSGIPGFVGGTPVQNVGAYGQEVSETIISVRCLDRKSGEIIELSNTECKFAYRTSIFNTTDKERFIVLAVKYALNVAGNSKIVYADLQKHFGEKIPTLNEMRQTVLAIRAAKSMVIDENDSNSRSAGSFFKNPIVSSEIFKTVEEKAKQLKLIEENENLPNYPVDGENVKIPAAWLIENSGFYKGYTRGNAGLSTNHALAITNRTNATAAEILGLKNEIQNKVNENFGIFLTPEPIFVGFD